MRIGMIGIDVPLSVFNNNNGVVDYQACGERDSEKRQRINGEPEYLDERECANERYRNGDCRNNGGAPIQQEEENDDDHDTMASSRVVTTSLTESPTTVVVSNAITYFIPGGKDLDKSCRAALAALSTSKAFALKSCWTPTPMASWPLYIRFVS